MRETGLDALLPPLDGEVHPADPYRFIERYARPATSCSIPSWAPAPRWWEAARRATPPGARISIPSPTGSLRQDRGDRSRGARYLQWLSTAAAALERHSAKSPALFAGSDAWFREDVARAIRAILNKARPLDAATRNFVEIGLSDLLKGMSNARMDRTVPMLPATPQYQDKKHYWRVVNNETRGINPFARVHSQLRRMQAALLDFHAHGAGRAEPFLHDARDLASLGRRAGLAVTHPLLSAELPEDAPALVPRGLAWRSPAPLKWPPSAEGLPARHGRGGGAARADTRRPLRPRHRRVARRDS
jgi:hypothetical protein